MTYEITKLGTTEPHTRRNHNPETDQAGVEGSKINIQEVLGSNLCHYTSYHDLSVFFYIYSKCWDSVSFRP
jgi:hypothetical protein